MTKKKPLGQYFTTDVGLQNYIYNHVKHLGSRLLEPSVGAGHLLQPFLATDPTYPMTCYELDASIKPVVEPSSPIIYSDFLSATGLPRYKTIIGNPPYVKKKGEGQNLYIQFIERCFDLLDEYGELLFIIPSDFFKLTSASSLLERMDAAGRFTHFYYPHDEGLFPGASVDVVVFRYERGGGVVAGPRIADVNGESKPYNVRAGLLTFGIVSDKTVGSLFDVYVGIVSAKDDVYKSPTLGNIDVLMDEGRLEKFIYVTEYPCANPAVNAHLLAHKDTLISRKIRPYTEKNWYLWGAPRNIELMKSRAGTPCIYVKTLTRQKRVAWVGTVGYYGGSLLCMIPKDGAIVDLDAVVAHINSESFQAPYIYAGRFKMGQKQLTQAYL